MTLTLDFQGQVLKKPYLINRMVDWHGTKGYEAISQTHFVTLNFDPTHDLDLRFSKSNFEQIVYLEWEGRLTWNEGDVVGMSDSLLDLELWQWLCIFMIMFWKRCIPWTEWLIIPADLIGKDGMWVDDLDLDHYKVMPFLIGWVHTQNDPCIYAMYTRLELERLKYHECKYYVTLVYFCPW